MIDTVAVVAATASVPMTQSPVLATDPAAVLNSKPEGRVSTMVPVPKTPALPSSTTGPVSAVYVPRPGDADDVSSDIAPPPEAGVTLVGRERRARHREESRHKRATGQQ